MVFKTIMVKYLNVVSSMLIVMMIIMVVTYSIIDLMA
jgi:hypothetical protein